MKNKTEINTEYLGVGIALIMALCLGYITFPSIVSLVIPEASNMMWESPITINQALGILVALLSIGFTLAIVNKFRRARTSGGSDIFPWLAVGFLVIASIAVTAFVFLFVFGVSVSTLLSFGIESAIAVFIGTILALVTAYLVTLKV